MLGAVVTTHKLWLFEAGRRRFDRLDPVAEACHEVNAILRHRDGSLEGWARDPTSVGRVVDRIWPDDAGQVTCLGAGGTTVALAYHLSTTRPGVQLACSDPNPEAVRRVSRVARGPVVGHVGRGPWDDLIADSPAGSLVVNATGMGKDRPGSPTTDRARFPCRSVVWELNYRGDLRLLDQARQQAKRGELEVHDGWELFCHGWAAALTVVLGLPDEAALGEAFVTAARPLRPVVTSSSHTKPG